MKKEQTTKPLQSLRVVPDTSIIVEGFLSRKIEANEINPSEVIIHEAVLAELESQANKNKETGYLGLEEIKKLRILSENNFEITFKGSRPTEFEIKHAKTGEIDSLIRSLAYDEKATLITADKVQALVAQSKGINVILFEFSDEETPFVLEKYFDEKTMSLHIKENCEIKAKKGSPKHWSYESVSSEKLDRETIKELAKDIIEEASASEFGFIDSEKKGSTIIQFKNNRILITRPPLSNNYEINCVRAIKKLSLKDYSLSKKIIEKINLSKGILISSNPGDGKTSFAQALAKYYSENKRIVTLVDSPRNEKVSDEITQLSLSQGSSVEISDILTLSKPDFVVFDEARSGEEFRLFYEIRLSGVSAACVLSSANIKSAVQKFTNKIDFEAMRNIIDLIIFIKAGDVEKVLQIVEKEQNAQTIILENIDSGKKEIEIKKTEDGFIFSQHL